MKKCLWHFDSEAENSSRFVKQIEEMANGQKKGTVFIDLFGGSGLVSHTIKQARPDCRVVYCRRLRTP